MGVPNKKLAGSNGPTKVAPLAITFVEPRAVAWKVRLPRVPLAWVAPVLGELTMSVSASVWPQTPAPMFDKSMGDRSRAARVWEKSLASAYVMRALAPLVAARLGLDLPASPSRQDAAADRAQVGDHASSRAPLPPAADRR